MVKEMGNLVITEAIAPAYRDTVDVELAAAEFATREQVTDTNGRQTGAVEVHFAATALAGNQQFRAALGHLSGRFGHLSPLRIFSRISMMFICWYFSIV